MKYIIRFVAVIICLNIGVISASAMGVWNLKETREQEALVMLDNLANWFITEGLAEYYKDSDFDKVEKHVTDKGAFIVGHRFWTFEESNVISLLLQHWWVRSDITCYERIELKDEVYEYWVISYGSKRPDFDSKKYYFLITKAEGLIMQRKIIYKSDKFFSRFTLKNGAEIGFPLHKRKALFDLEPWYHPEAFVGTELEGVEEGDFLNF